MDLSVLIPAYNEERLLPQQLEALVAQKWERPWEILVVDNKSTDGTAAVVADFARRFDHIRRVEAFERQGLAYTRNVGVGAANGRAVAFCDADDVVEHDWVRRIGESVLEHSCVTGPLELDRLNPPALAGSRGRDDERRAPTFHGMFPTVHGNNFAIERSLYEAVGGSDETISRPSAEDVELSLRLWLKGVVPYFDAGAVVHYRYRTQPRELFRQGKAYGACRPLVARRLLAATGRRPPRLVGWRSWVWLLANLPSVRSADGRARWAWVAGNRYGQLVGSVRERHVLL